MGVTSHILTAKETKNLYPLMNTEDIYGTLYSPADGTIDPAGYCSALIKGATLRGTKVFIIRVTVNYGLSVHLGKCIFPWKNFMCRIMLEFI